VTTPARPTPLRVYFHLLDRQIVDRNDTPVGNVDDVELEVGPDGRLRITALLCGLAVLGRRIDGRPGRLMTRLARRFADDGHPQPLRIPWDQVAEVSSAVRLRISKDLLDDPPLEKWLREHLIDRIPGAKDAG
jgi:sporulation protein YlmC with PRC-barrel domain